MPGKMVVLLSLALACAALGGSGGAKGAGTCTLAPQLVNVTVNQGLGGYTNLVRGKSTVVRGFWSVPSCMGTTDANGVLTNGGFIQIDNETLTVKNTTAGTTLASNLSTTPGTLGPTYPVTNVVVAAPGRRNAPSDASFLVPGAVLAPPGTTAAYTASFEITVTYQVLASSGAATLGSPVVATYTTLSGSRTAITKPVAQKTNALPILLVPMGFALDATSATAIGSAVQTLDRVFPVPDGVGPLDGTTGGVRYAISPGLLDTSDLLDSNNKFCGNSANFNTIKARLAAFLQTWNTSPTTTTLGVAVTSTTATTMTVASTTGFPTAVPFRAYVDNELVKVTAVSGTTWTVTRGFEGTTAATHAAGAPITLSTNQAQKVIGIVNAANSDSGAVGGVTCFDGYASTAAPQGWIRLSDRAGALLDMELAHTFGVVPATRYDGLSPYHSLHSDADNSDADAAYSTADGSYISDDHSAMRFVDGPSPTTGTPLVTGLWGTSNTVLEAADYAMILCKLGGPTTSDCATSGGTGTSVGVPAAPAVNAFTLIGNTDGTAAGTHITSSGEATTVTTAADASSLYRLVEKPSGTNYGVPVSFADSIHTHGGESTEPNPFTTQGFFNVAFPFAASTSSVELWKVPLVNGTPGTPGSSGSTLLWSVNQSATPQITATASPPILSPAPSVSAPSVTEPTPVVNRPTGPPPRFGRRLSRAAATGVDASTDASAIANAIAADPSTVAGAAFDAAPPTGTPDGIASSSFNGFPTNGSSFGILTTGDVNLANTANTSTSSGADDGGGPVRGNTDYDDSILRIDLNVPTGANCLSFDFRFLSEEYPEFVGTQYNDAFVAELDSSTWTTSGSTISAPNNFAFDPSHNVVSINSTGATAMSAGAADGTTYDGATPLLTASTSITPGAHSLYLSIFDQGDRVYDSAVFLDNLIIGTTSPSGCIPGAHPKSTSQTVTGTVTDDGPTTSDTVNLTLRCPNDANQLPVVLAVLVPVAADGTFSQTITQGQTGCMIDAQASDGFSSSQPTDIASSELDTIGASPPTAAINTPTPDRKYLQFDGITLVGTGYSSLLTGGGALPDDDLTWTSTLFAGTKTGSTVPLSPPAGGWTPGTYSATLHVTDGSLSADATVSFTILGDNDHDGLPTTIDQQPCLASLGGDNNPLNAAADPEGDGLIAIDDIFQDSNGDPYAATNTAACVAQTAYAGNGIYAPTPISLSSTHGALSVAGILVPHRNLAQVPTSGVSITAINGQPVPATSGLQAKQWLVSGNLGAASFNLQNLIAYLKANHFGPGTIVMTITGLAPTWRFDAPINVVVKP